MKSGCKSELEENCANFANAQSRFIELEVNDIVICVQLVTKAGDLDELPIQFEDLAHFAQTTRINFKFDHLRRILTTSLRNAILLVSPTKCGIHFLRVAIAPGAKLRKRWPLNG